MLSSNLTNSVNTDMKNMKDLYKFVKKHGEWFKLHKMTRSNEIMLPMNKQNFAKKKRC